MADPILVDTTFDVRSDARGKDPDSHSATLRRYHRLLWSKPLPNGMLFDLDANLLHSSELGDVWLSSDSIGHTYSRMLTGIVEEISSEENTAFFDLACTVGAYVVFPPQVRVDGKWRLSINQARGLHPKIRDRFDLTLECIRRHYLGEELNPLSRALEPYAFFFDLFEDFCGYVDHFLLQDLVTRDGARVRFFKEFDDFSGNPLPSESVAEYREYMKRSMDFISARNARIALYTTATPLVRFHDRR